MLKLKENYPEVNQIQNDISALKEDSLDLARHVKDDGAEQINVLSDKAAQAYAEMKSRGADEMKKIEGHVKERPGQSLAIAFISGVAISYLLRRR
jgi:ElaB/YqjD/DUF883 family membrane-anchored ribosome-binding protein